jgi:hypothetical protein
VTNNIIINIAILLNYQLHIANVGTHMYHSISKMLSANRVCNTNPDLVNNNISKRLYEYMYLLATARIYVHIYYNVLYILCNTGISRVRPVFNFYFFYSPSASLVHSYKYLLKIQVWRSNIVVKIYNFNTL